MTDVVLVRQKVESGKTAQLRDWMAELREREEEVIETLQREGMHSETAFLEHSEDGGFPLYYMKADDIERAIDSFEQSSHDVDEQHKQVMDEVLVSGENVGEYELLFHVDNPER